MSEKSIPAHRNRALAVAWMVNLAAFSLHAAEEALNGFLNYYEHLARRVSYIPDWKAETWLLLLILLALSLSLLTPLACRGRKVIAVLGSIFGFVFLFNGVQHLIWWWMGWWPASGVFTAPLMGGAAIYLLFSCYCHGRGKLS